MPLFQKILIANRGEIAVRVVRACQEMGIGSVAVYSEADACALHTILADEAVLLGPPPPLESYLRADLILQAALERSCDAIHPGYGFLSENANFADAVRAAGLTFIGPDSTAIHAMGDKITSREIMKRAGVPIVAGCHPIAREPEKQMKELRELGPKIGFPLLVKATAGGGGKGMRIVEVERDLAAVIESAQREALNAFGDPTLYLEKRIVRPRHIEFQVLADRCGNTIHLFERECSIQRRYQKIVEETPSPALNPELRARMGAAAVSAAQAVHYTNAGTVEFLLAEDGEFYFLEMNTRLQVEHPITEQVTGIDLVKAQINIAAGEPLPWRQEDVNQRHHAIECRIYAEDPANNFMPSTGPVLLAEEPVGPGVRVDTGITTGVTVSIYYDPMISKLICLGENRPDAIRKMDWALSHYIVLGITTNIPFLRAIVEHPAFVAGELSTDFVERHLSGWAPDSSPVPDEALIAAALADMLGDGNGVIADGANARGDPCSPWQALDSFRIGAGY